MAQLLWSSGQECCLSEGFETGCDTIPQNSTCLFAVIYSKFSELRENIPFKYACISIIPAQIILKIKPIPSKYWKFESWDPIVVFISFTELNHTSIISRPFFIALKKLKKRIEGDTKPCRRAKSLLTKQSLKCLLSCSDSRNWPHFQHQQIRVAFLAYS